MQQSWILSSLCLVFLLSNIMVMVQCQTSCPADMNLTEFNPPNPSATATFLDIDFTCIYNDFSAERVSYQFVPAPFVRVEPGDRVAFYSTPPDIYDIIDRNNDGTAITLAHNAITEQPGQTALVITWPADQLERLRLGSVNSTLLLVEGFTNLKELNVTGRLGGLEAYISSDDLYLNLQGEQEVATHIQMMSSSSEAKLTVDIEIGVADIEIAAPDNSITGTIHAPRMTDRSGKVFLQGVESVDATGQGPGMVYANDCSKVTGNCQPFNANTTLESPDTDCRLTNVCLVTAFSLSQPARTCSGQFPEGGTYSCPGDNSTGEDGSNSGSVSRKLSKYYFIVWPVALAVLLVRPC
jgi:hypothetical protein